MYAIRDAISLNGQCRFNYHYITETALICVPTRRQTCENFIASTCYGENRIVSAALQIKLNTVNQQFIIIWWYVVCNKYVCRKRIYYVQNLLICLRHGIAGHCTLIFTFGLHCFLAQASVLNFTTLIHFRVCVKVFDTNFSKSVNSV